MRRPLVHRLQFWAVLSWFFAIRSLIFTSGEMKLTPFELFKHFSAINSTYFMSGVSDSELCIACAKLEAPVSPCNRNYSSHKWPLAIPFVCSPSAPCVGPMSRMGYVCVCVFLRAGKQISLFFCRTVQATFDSQDHTSRWYAIASDLCGRTVRLRLRERKWVWE